MNLVLLHGLPGVGKLAVGQALNDLTGYSLFHNHLTVDLLLSVFEFGTPPFLELRDRIWIDVMARAAEEGFSGLVFTFAFGASLPGFYDRLRRRVEAAGGAICPVELRCDLEENERRVVQPDRATYGKIADLVLFRARVMSGDFQAPDMEGNLVIDNTNLTPLEVARRIVEHFALPAPR